MSYKRLEEYGDSGHFGSFGVTVEDLALIIDNDDMAKYQQLGGVEGVAKALKSDIHTGLSENEEADGYKARKEVFGGNFIKQKDLKPFWRFFFEALQDKTLMILMAAAVISIILGTTIHKDDEGDSGWIEGTAILIAVFLVASVSSGNDYHKERQFRKLSEVTETSTKAQVIRGGKNHSITVPELNTGDLLVLNTGDFIPADAFFVSGSDLQVNESAMTGEPEPIRKSEQRPFLLSGCQVVAGVGNALVVGVGLNSKWGRIKSQLDSEQEDTPLQIKLELLAETIGKLGVAAAIITFIALILKWGIGMAINGETWEWGKLTELLKFLIICITIIVVAVPEGLPLAVTISLAFSMFKMIQDNNLVRHLAACETMGGATCICSDKTGTLTENRMTVKDMWIGGQRYAENVPKAKDLNPTILKVMVEGMNINSNANISINSNGILEYVGSQTECALLKYTKEIGFDYEVSRKQTTVEKAFPFSSSRKQMQTVVKNKEKGDYRMHVKGASEIVVEGCTQVIDANGNVSPFTNEMKSQAKKTIEAMAGTGLRTLCLAFKDFQQLPDLSKAPDSTGLTCMCICGIKDPLRPEVPEAVAACQRAGIVVRMVTGDNILTAQHIARECGILIEGGVCIEGPQFRAMSDTQLDDLIPKLRVLARSSPEDKLRLVQRLKANGEVVASTGDGVNDALQLNEADVGFSMNLTGTAVAREASDIILLDDNFSSIVKAVMWGRNVYDSIRKFIQFQLTVNLVAVVVAFIGAVSNGDSPLKPVQLLWVNLIMDTFAALALATEAPTADLLDRPPYGRFDSLITVKMWRKVIGQGIYQLAVLLVLLYAGERLPFLTLQDETDPKHRAVVLTTIIFNAFVWCQIFNEINCRKLEDDRYIFRGFFSNWIFLSVIGVTVLGQTLIVEFGGEFTSTSHLQWNQWLACIIIGFISIPYGYLVTLVPVPEWKRDEEETPLLMNRKDSRWGDLSKKIRLQLKVVHTFRRFRR